MHNFGADRAFILIRLQWRLATRATMPIGLDGRLPSNMTGQLDLELVEQAYGVQIAPKRESPSGQAPICVVQFQMANTGVVMVLKNQTRPKWPRLPRVIPRQTAHDALIGHEHPTVDKTKFGTEVNREGSQNVFFCLEQGPDVRLQIGRNIVQNI